MSRSAAAAPWLSRQRCSPTPRPGIAGRSATSAAPRNVQTGRDDGSKGSTASRCRVRQRQRRAEGLGSGDPVPVAMAAITLAFASSRSRPHDGRSTSCRSRGTRRDVRADRTRRRRQDDDYLSCGLLRLICKGGRLDSTPVREHRRLTGSVGYLSQLFTLYAIGASMENIVLFAASHGAADYRARRDRLLEMTQPRRFGSRLAHRLSGRRAEWCACLHAVHDVLDLLMTVLHPAVAASSGSRRPSSSRRASRSRGWRLGRTSTRPSAAVALLHEGSAARARCRCREPRPSRRFVALTTGARLKFSRASPAWWGRSHVFAVTGPRPDGSRHASADTLAAALTRAGSASGGRSRLPPRSRTSSSPGSINFTGRLHDDVRALRVVFLPMAATSPEDNPQRTHVVS